MIVQTMYLEKQPARGGEVGGAGVALHQDLHYLPCEPETLMACWIALSDADAENGGLCVVPGSHRHGLYSTHKNPNAQEHDAWEIEYLMRDRAGNEWTQRMYSFEIDGLNHDDVALGSQNFRPKLFFEAGHDADHHDQRGDAERDSDDRNH